MNANLSPDQFKSYTKHYNAGYTHSMTAAEPDIGKSDAYGVKNATHGGGDFSTNAWTDGYLDAAAGYDKYAFRTHRFQNNAGDSRDR